LSFYSLYLPSFLVVGVEAGAATAEAKEEEEEEEEAEEERQILEHLQALTR
jgi:hypothetical protein